MERVMEQMMGQNMEQTMGENAASEQKYGGTISSIVNTLSAEWGAYLTYLSEWTRDHSDVTFYGMSPVSFGEWKDWEAAREVD